MVAASPKGYTGATVFAPNISDHSVCPMTAKPLFFILGLLLLVLSVILVPPLLTDIIFQHEDWKIFAFCIVVSAFFGGGLVMTQRTQSLHFTLREAFLANVLGWLLVCAFSALPFHFCQLDLTFTDSFFEAVSGLTTTGASIMIRLDDAAPGILIWRAMLQWIGGLGILITALSVAPYLSIGGMQIFRAELSENEKTLPRMISLSLSVFLIYCALTLACLLSYLAAGMGKFDSLAHAMTTVSTGGFSTHDASLGYFENPALQYIASFFMLLSALPFLLYLKVLKGHTGALLRDSQVRWFLGMLILAILACTTSLIRTEHMPLEEAFRSASFNIVSLASGTGYTVENYNLWNGFVFTLFFFLMAVGACAGSTSCGIKIFRFQILWAVIQIQFKRLLYPNGTFIAHYNGRPLPRDVPLSVLSFLFLYALSFAGLSLILAFLGLDTLTALSGSISALSNVGPGLGDVIGPMGNYASLPNTVKWVLSFGMLLGRLEILSVLILFHPAYWRE